MWVNQLAEPTRLDSSRDCAICEACAIVIGRFDSNAKLLTKYLAIRIQKERMEIKKKKKAKLQLKAIKKAICE